MRAFVASKFKMVIIDMFDAFLYGITLIIYALITSLIIWVVLYIMTGVFYWVIWVIGVIDEIADQLNLTPALTTLFSIRWSLV